MPQHFETMQCAICRVRVCMRISVLSFIWDVSECSWRRRLRLLTHQRSDISSFPSVGLLWSRFSDVWRFRVCCCCVNRGRPGAVFTIFLVFSVWFVGLGESVETRLPCTGRVLNKVQISGCWPLLSLVFLNIVRAVCCSATATSERLILKLPVQLVFFPYVTCKRVTSDVRLLQREAL